MTSAAAFSRRPWWQEAWHAHDVCGEGPCRAWPRCACEWPDGGWPGVVLEAGFADALEARHGAEAKAARVGIDEHPPTPEPAPLMDVWR
jgi:hypothetical protein